MIERTIVPFVSCHIHCLTTIFGGLIAVSCLITSNALCEKPNKVFGELNIQETDEKKSESYSMQQENALNFTKELSTALNSSSSSGHNLSDSTIYYLTGLMLFCSAKAGACPFILDTLLANEHLSNKNNPVKECRSMKKFWSYWTANSFEERLPYLVPIGSTEALNQFKTNKRPAYIKCEQTLKTFSVDKEIARSVALTMKLIEQVKEKQINVFEATGTQRPTSQESN